MNLRTIFTLQINIVNFFLKNKITFISLFNNGPVAQTVRAGNS